MTYTASRSGDSPSQVWKEPRGLGEGGTTTPTALAQKAEHLYVFSGHPITPLRLTTAR
jgi:hypothetical protein